MSTKSRVKKLEKAFTPKYVPMGWTPPGWSKEGEFARLKAECIAIADLGVDEEQFELVLQFLEDHFIQMIQAVMMPPSEDGYKKIFVPQLRLFPRVTRLLLEKTPPDLRSAILTPDSLGMVHTAIVGHPPSRWLDSWIRHIADFDCRVPPDVKPETTRSLVDVYLHHLDQVDTFDMVCTTCGLCRPSHKRPPYSEWRVLPGKTPMVGDPPWYDLPEFFRDCPNCGTHDMMWRHRTHKFQYAWRALAMAELDSGC